MVRIIQFSDAHLESPMSALSREKAELRRTELRMALCAAIRLAGERDYKIALLPGDLFDQNFASETTLAMLAAAFSDAADTAFFIAPGNHDPIGPRSPYVFYDFPENVYVFRENEMTEFRYSDEISIYGCAGLPRPYERAPLENFSVRDRNILNLGVVHGMVTGSAAVPYGPISREQIAASGLDYLALGHVHGTVLPERCDDTFYAYSGCLEGRGFDECGEKGLLLLELEKGKCAATFLTTSIRKLHYFKVDISGVSSSEEAARRIAELCTASPRDIVRYELTGELAKNADVDAATIAALLPESFYSEVVIKAEICTDYRELAGGETLLSQFVRLALLKIEKAADAEAKKEAEFALKYGVEALGGKKVSADGCDK